MYFPVAEETLGGTPMLINTGLNTVPPPNPRAPQTRPPIKEISKSFTSTDPVNLRSDGARPLLYFTFKLYSLLTILRDT